MHLGNRKRVEKCAHILASSCSHFEEEEIPQNNESMQEGYPLIGEDCQSEVVLSQSQAPSKANWAG